MINKLLNNESADYALLNSRGFNRDISTSLRRLGSGLRINTAIDDSAGMQIADGLKLQFTSHKQAARNAEQTADIVKIATNAVKEQTNILAKIKSSAIQASQDSLDKSARASLQKEIGLLVDQLDRIALSTKYNNQSLLTGNFSNKKFQIGASANETASLSFASLLTDKLGATSFLSYDKMTTSGSGTLDITIPSTGRVVNIQATISTNAGTGIGALADKINGASDQLDGLKAYWKVQSTGNQAIVAGDLTGITLNGITIPDITGVKTGDDDGRLLDAFKKYEIDTGVETFINNGVLNFRSVDGRGIDMSATGLNAMTGIADTFENYGRLTLTRSGSSNITVATTGLTLGAEYDQEVVNLRDVKKSFTQAQAESLGMFANDNQRDEMVVGGRISAGVLTRGGAAAIMDVVTNSLKQIDTIAADIGSNYNALIIAADNNSAQVTSVQAAHTELVGVDFAVESNNFSKANILAQAGTYALTKSQQVVRNVFKLLEV